MEWCLTFTCGSGKTARSPYELAVSLGKDGPAGSALCFAAGREGVSLRRSGLALIVCLRAGSGAIHRQGAVERNPPGTGGAAPKEDYDSTHCAYAPGDVTDNVRP